MLTEKQKEFHKSMWKITFIIGLLTILILSIDYTGKNNPKEKVFTAEEKYEALRIQELIRSSSQKYYNLGVIDGKTETINKINDEKIIPGREFDRELNTSVIRWTHITEVCSRIFNIR